MKITKRIFLVIIMLVQIGAFGEDIISLKDFLKSELSSFESVSKETFDIDDEQIKKMKNLAATAEDKTVTFYYGKTKGGKIDKICVQVPQKGKEGPMLIGVCYGKDGLINSVKILSSEEDRGRKAMEQSYLKQYLKKKVSDSYEIGKDVDGVTGATWTSKAIAEGLRKSGFFFQTFLKEKLQ